jgi:rhodanese-related sulfurtransferase
MTMRKQMLMGKGLIVAFALVFALSLPAIGLADMAGADFVKAAKKTIKEVPLADAKAEIEAGKPVVIVDVRTEKEFKNGHLPKAVHADRGTLEFQIAKKLPKKDAEIIVYCKGGDRSSLATATLMQMGYKNVKSMSGGWDEWVKAGYPVE